MAVAEYTITIDGQTYNKGDTLPDLGSWVATSAEGNIRHYEGLSTDVSKLPKYVEAGSSALCVDTGDYYKFLKSTNTWYQITVDTEQIEQAVNDYLEENPPSGMTTEQEQQLNKNTEDISSLSEDKVDKPPVSDDGKIPRAMGGEVEWVEVGQPTDDQTNNAVEKWLNEHPEATTTVQDGSIEEVKFSDTLRNRKASYYNFVSEMKADNSLKGGMAAVTLGYQEPNDGGGATYRIRAKLETDIDDGGSIHELNGGQLVAELIIEEYVTPEMFGAVGDGVHDDSEAIQKAINNPNIHKLIINNTYKIKNPINIYRNNLSIIGTGSFLFDKSDFNFNDIFCIYVTPSDENGLIENISFNGITFRAFCSSTDNIVKDILCIKYTKNFKFIDCTFELEENSYWEPFEFRSGNINSKVINCIFNDNGKNHETYSGGGFIIRQYDSSIDSDISIVGCIFNKNNSDEVIFISTETGNLKVEVFDCKFFIGKDSDYGPDHCFTVITKGKVELEFNSCIVYAYKYGASIFFDSPNSTGVCNYVVKNCFIKTFKESGGIISRVPIFNNNIVFINNNITYDSGVSYFISLKSFCHNDVFFSEVSSDRHVISYCPIVKGNLIRSEDDSEVGTCFYDCINILDNLVDIKFYNFCSISKQICGNTVSRRGDENFTEIYRIDSNKHSEVIIKDNQFDFWCIININKEDVKVLFIGNHMFRATLDLIPNTENSFSSCYNTAQNPYVGTGWSDKDIVI